MCPMRGYGEMTASCRRARTLSVMALLTLVLKVLLVGLAAWITTRAFRRSVGWGLFFLLAPACWLVLRVVLGGVAAALLLGAVQLLFVRRDWRRDGPPYAAAALLLAVIGVLTHGTFRGWLP